MANTNSSPGGNAGVTLLDVGANCSPISVTSAGTAFTGTEISVAASGSSTIPITAVQWTVIYFGTGTANTFGSSTAITAPCSISGTGKPTVAIAVAADSSSSAVIIYSTT